MNKQEQIKQEEVTAVYEKPTIEVIEMEMEGILCGSGGSSGGDYGNGGGVTPPGW